MNVGFKIKGSSYHFFPRNIVLLCWEIHRNSELLTEWNIFQSKRFQTKCQTEFSLFVIVFWVFGMAAISDT